MPLLIKKLCVGVKSINALEEWQKGAGLEKAHRFGYQTPFHRTRNVPLRREHLLDGGSIYWVIGHAIQLRQKLIDLRIGQNENGRYCDLLLAKNLIKTIPVACRPFQGWRYLEEKNAPRDLTDLAACLHEKTTPYEPMPPEMALKLAKMGLL